MKQPIVIDSSVWIEIFSNGKLAEKCLEEVSLGHNIGVPAVVLYEVYKKILKTRSEEMAMSTVAFLRQFQVLDFNSEIALQAADLSVTHSLGMADSVVLAHALMENASLISMENDFSGLKGAKIIR